MITIIVRTEDIQEKTIKVNDLGEINHIKNVFRKNKNDKIRVVDGKKEYLCEIKSIETKEMMLEILEKKEDEYLIDTEIDAGICLLKNDKMDLTIQKLTELGINKIIPISAKRTVVKLTKKKDKWDTIVKETLKQCQGVKPTEIDKIKKITDIDYSLYDLVVVPYECEEEIKLKDVLLKLEKKPKKILYLIGSEGGFEKEEIDFLKNHNSKIVSLGKRILRAETAAIVTGGLLVNEFQ